MNQPLTFGKFQGWTPLELAQAGEVGRGYLAWGAEHLESPKWRRAFEEALHAKVTPDASLMAKAMVRDDKDLSHEEALYIAREEIAQEEEISAMLAAIDQRHTEIAKHWAEIMSVTPEKLRGLARQYEWSEWDQLPASRFSSPQMHQSFLSFMAAWSEAYDEE